MTNRLQAAAAIGLIACAGVRASATEGPAPWKYAFGQASIALPKAP